MKTRTYITVIAIALTGCATQSDMIWVKDGATEEQFRRDKITCQQYGMQSAQANGLSGNMFVAVWINDEAKKCMENLGYKLQSKKQKTPDNQSTLPNAIGGTSVQPSQMACGLDSDCNIGQSCRSRKGGGTECRASAKPTSQPIGM